MSKYEFPEDAEEILKLRPMETFEARCGGHGISVEYECGTYEIYEWLPDRPAEHTLSFLESEVDLVIAEVAS